METNLDEPGQRTISLEWSHPVVTLANHFAFSPQQVEGPWAAASRLLIYVRDGTGDVIRSGRRKKMVRGDYCLLEWGEPVRYAADAKDPFALLTIHFVLHIPRGRQTPAFRHLKSPKREYEDDEGNCVIPEIDRMSQYGTLTGMPHIMLLLDRMVEEFHRPTEITLAMRAAYAKVILAELVAASSQCTITLSHPRLADVLRVRDYLEWNYQEPLTREWMAQMAGMSPAHFTRAFRAVTGRTPHQFLVARRLIEAQSLLRMTTGGLKEIAAKTGFGDAFHLSHAFKAEYGLSPQAFRRKTLGR